MFFVDSFSKYPIGGQSNMLNRGKQVCGGCFLEIEQKMLGILEA